MPCSQCAERDPAEQPRRTALGSRTFRCGRCRRAFHERTGTPFNQLQYPTDPVLLVVRWRLRCKLSLRDLAEMFLVRGCAFSHEAVREWEARFAPLPADRMRAKRRGKAGAKWHADETYVRVGGRWCYLYRAIDRDGNLVDAPLSEKRDMDAARRFFRQALDLAGRAPERVTTDGLDAYPRAIRETPGDAVTRRTSRFKNTRSEQDHRGAKQRCDPMRGSGSVISAARLCAAFEAQRQFSRAVRRSGAAVSLADRRRMLRERWATAMAEFATV